MGKINGIKNIIFDFGGVVINLDSKLTIEKLKSLGLSDFEDHFTQHKQSGLFNKLETGMISSEEFIDELVRLYPVPPDKSELINAWNAMLLDFPKERALLLRHLKTRYNTYLLSNTNELHLNYYFGKLKDWYGVVDMSSFFHKEYYSCNLHMRKPDREIFEYVIKDNDLDPSETLFIDDSLLNIEGAVKLGLKTHHLVGPETIMEIFNDH